VPQRLLADTTAMTQDDIVKLAERYPGMTVYSPPSPERTDVTAETLRKRRWKHRHEPPAVQAWRARMASEDGQETYRRRKLTERAHGTIKNRGMSRFLVHGRERSAPSACCRHWRSTLAGPIRCGSCIGNAGNRMICRGQQRASCRHILGIVLQSASNTSSRRHIPRTGRHL
jgi:hypothetical protein